MIALTGTCIVVDLDPVAALVAEDPCARCTLTMADAIVQARVLAHRADLLTCDRHLEGLPGVRLVPKSRG